MYNKIFKKFYGFYKKREDSDPVFDSATAVFFAQAFQVGMLLAIINNAIEYEIPEESIIRSLGKYFFFPLGMIWLIIVYYYYKSYAESMDKSTITKNGWKDIILISMPTIITPLIAIIFFSGGFG